MIVILVLDSAQSTLNIFLQTIMEDAEFLKIHGKYFLEDIRKQYNIDGLIVNDGYVYCKVKKGLYGLK